MWERLSKHWFLAALAACFLVGYLLANPLRPLLEMGTFRSFLVFAVMWGMGVTLKPDAIRRSMLRPMPSVLAIAINTIGVPLICVPAIWLLPPNLAGGLFVASIVPCTLASASVWTRKAGGDDSVAMMTTVVTNLACIFVAPLGIAFVLARQTEVNAIEQMTKLAIVVVIPLVLAQVMRRMGLSNWADRNKSRISFLALLGILFMVLFGAVAAAHHTKASGDASAGSWMAVVAVAGLAILVHITAFLIGILSSRLLGHARETQIAVGFSGSQKTLMVGLQIAIDCGVSVIPMMVFHAGQLVFDTVVAAKWKATSDAGGSQSDAAVGDDGNAVS